MRSERSIYQTTVPGRLDRLPWTRFHWLIVCALGITWILDGLEVTVKSAISGILQNPASLGLNPEQIGMIASFYLIGAVIGALLFGYLTDRLGRKKLFFITLSVYMSGVFLSAFSWNLSSFIFFRLLTGAGIGGEYAAINSAIDELIPARVRGRVDLIINGSYWLGAALASVSTLYFLDTHRFSADLGWRLCFGLGGFLGLGVLLLRKWVPESPRWLTMHGRHEEAEAIVSQIEKEIEEKTGQKLEPMTHALTIRPRGHVTFGTIMDTMFNRYRKCAAVGLSLMVSQAFLYNAIFFTYAMVLTNFYHIKGSDTGIYLLPFAISNFLGPLVLGRWFDSWGRRQMIFGTYFISAILLVATGYVFSLGALTALTQTLLWSLIFFFASPAASSAYLTVSEVFPLETRGMAISVFFAIGTLTGGVAAPWLFGVLIGTGSRTAIFYGYVFAAVLMTGAAVIELYWGIPAERRSLEEVAAPLSADDTATV